jgi:DNA-binding transcriptional regulator YiaG
MWHGFAQWVAVSPAEVRAARQHLGLSTNGLAEALALGKGGGRTVRRWESGETPITGPASVAIRLMLTVGSSTTPKPTQSA